MTAVLCCLAGGVQVAGIGSGLPRPRGCFPEGLSALEACLAASGSPPSPTHPALEFMHCIWYASQYAVWWRRYHNETYMCR